MGHDPEVDLGGDAAADEDEAFFSDHQELINEGLDAAEDEDVAPPTPAPPTPAPPTPAPPTPVAANDQQRRWVEDARGYVKVDGRSGPIGRITVWGRSVSARCMVHQRCTRPYTIRALPPGHVLQEWLVSGLDQDSASQHMNLPKPASA